MQVIGFVLFVIGCGITFGARRIVMAKTKVDKEDKDEFELLASGGIIAIKVTGFIVAAIGFIFLMIA